MSGGDFVLMARRRAGLTQRELGERLGLRQATIARWERGDRGVTVEDVEMVAHACGLQLDAHLLVEDRSWWPQIAVQLELEPLDRLARLALPDAPDMASALWAFGHFTRSSHGARYHDGMQRIMVQADARLLDRARARAAERGVSVAQVFRDALERDLGAEPAPPAPASIAMIRSERGDLSHRASDDEYEPEPSR